jgi:2-C-methyl-D-erythritol 2,4-cyclodiphosphate synthase
VTLRVGHAIDSHRLVTGRPLMLGCVAVPSERGLAGHSDGDVAAHALCDACLGAAALGTMGDHFPSSDERWRGVPGREFLASVAARLAERGAQVVSAQVALVCAAPRLAPHLREMGEAMSEALASPPGTVSVTATSGDGFGAAGRGEGILASAVVLVELGPRGGPGGDPV